MKKFCLVLIIILMATMLCGCSSIPYDEAKTSDTYTFSNGYFTVIKEWGETLYSIERIVYANDTGVMYYVFRTSYGGGITPLYNADGTLQVYEGK